MAYGAVVCLLEMLENILNPHLKAQKIHHYNKRRIKSIQGTMVWFRDEFLKASWPPTDVSSRHLERKLRDATHKAQDIIESFVSKERNVKQKVFVASPQPSCPPSYGELKQVKRELDSIKDEARTLLSSRQDADYLSPSPFQPGQATSNKNLIVGFEDDVLKIKKQLVGGSLQRKTIALVGMEGSGKTTLAKHLYNDPFISNHFDARAWVTVSGSSRVRKFLLGLLHSIGLLNDLRRQESDDRLKGYLHQHLLRSRRYLIVLDNMWSHKEVWDELAMLFPNKVSGSRIMLTTRIHDMASHANPHQVHEMRFLHAQESWALLCRNVCGDRSCPRELEEIGKKITQSCKGLPLAIVVIGHLLSKIRRMPSHWEYFAKHVKSFENVYEKSISGYLLLSYSLLPPHLKPCFLYMGIFPDDHHISVSDLFQHWIAEGFIELSRSKSLEEVAEGYLEDLISRNLILVHKKRFDGSTKTCKMHDVVRELCMIKAKEENFLDSMSFESKSTPQGGTRRLGIFSKHSSDGVDDIFKTIKSLRHLRSLIYTGPPCNDESHDFCCSELVRVLDLSKVNLGTFIDEILMLFHLRYLTFSSIGDIHIPKSFPDHLWYLQTFIIHQKSDNKGRILGKVYLPPSMEKMTQLRHLKFGKANFPTPYSNLDNLQTLVGISSACCTKKLFNKTPNLKKLGVRVEESCSGVSIDSFPDHAQILDSNIKHLTEIAMTVGSSIGEKFSRYRKGIFNEPQILKNKGTHVEESSSGGGGGGGGGSSGNSEFSFDCLVNLSQLEILKCTVEHGTSISTPLNLSFPRTLTRLTLSNTRIPWEEMSIIGSLLNLQVLKLRNFAFHGQTWETDDDEFLQLQYLLIDGTDLLIWIVNDSDHFPKLRKLVLQKCYKLEAIPSVFGEIDTIEEIELDDASPSAVASAKQIEQEYQNSRGDGKLSIHVRYLWESIIKHEDKNKNSAKGHGRT